MFVISIQDYNPNGVVHRKTTKMTTSEVIHSFLEEQPVNRTNDNICIRFVRKKFKCIIIFCLTICVLAEASMLILEKTNITDLWDKILNKMNLTAISYL